MKRLITILLAIVMCLSMSALFACAPEQAVSVKYYAKAEDMISMLKTGNLSIGLLPEPAATKLTGVASEKTWYRLDVQEEYDSVKKAYPQAVMLVKETLLSAHPEIVTQMASTFDANVTWVKTNTATAVGAVNGALESGEPTLNATNINSDVVDGCKIYWQGASDAKSDVNAYISAIRAIDEISAEEVTDNFYYSSVTGKTFDNDTVTVVAPDGAPALAIAKFIHDGETFGTGKTFNYKVVPASNIGAQVMQGKGDIVIIPVNAASKLYNSNASNPYKMVSVVTHGNLYIMSTEQITLADLKGKTIGVIGQGLVPDLTLKAIFAKYGIKSEIAL